MTYNNNMLLLYHMIEQTRSVIIKRCMCNHIDVNEPVLELVRIENANFNKKIKLYY